uniref:Eukaryotic elongation factor, selenocysteine-tRNA specific n=1 Tax=Chrysemys picta bellii TaxID=8478 RepID=A0A8C3HM90_CHRPI
MSRTTPRPCYMTSVGNPQPRPGARRSLSPQRGRNAEIARNGRRGIRVAAGALLGPGPAACEGNRVAMAGSAAVAAPGPSAPRRLNVNVGVLGHIDSGKTALARALSTTSSTAAFDRAPQSRARGITLDLGFSCLRTPLPPHLGPGPGELQLTLVDCPGHASLIRTIIGGAQIIDLMMLVIDVTKGMQTQSAECLVIGQIACQKMVVVLNKIDLLPEGKRQAAIEKMTKKMQKTLENTKFQGCPIAAVAAKPGGPEAPETVTPLGVSELIEVLKSQAYLPTRDPTGPFLMAIDHCFSIKGQGTVMTGTVLSGSVSLGDNVEIPALKVLDDYSVIGRSLFKKETNIQIFVGLKVKLSTGEDGVIEGGFGQSGKFKIRIPNGLKSDTKVFLTVPSKKKSKAGKGDAAKEDESSKVDSAQPVTINLLFKRYVFDTQKKMIQS